MILKNLCLNSIAIIFVLSFIVYLQNNAFNFQICHIIFTKPVLCIEMYLLQQLNLTFPLRYPKDQIKIS